MIDYYERHMRELEQRITYGRPLGKICWTKLSRRMFYAMGGFSNPDLCRQMKQGSWTYWRHT